MKIGLTLDTLVRKQFDSWSQERLVACSSQSAHRRLGMTLVEVVLAGSLILMAIGFMAEWTIRMVQLNRRVEQTMNDRQSLDRLASILTSDCRDATSWESEGRVFQVPSARRIEYSEQNDCVLRLEREGDRILHREFYRIPQGYRLVFPSASEVGESLHWRLAFSEDALPTSRLHAADCWSLVVLMGRAGKLHSVEMISVSKEAALPEKDLPEKDSPETVSPETEDRP